MSETLQQQKLCIVPEAQIESFNNSFGADVCHFDMYTQPFKMAFNHNLKAKIKKSLENRPAISNISAVQKSTTDLQYK